LVQSIAKNKSTPTLKAAFLVWLGGLKVENPFKSLSELQQGFNVLNTC